MKAKKTPRAQHVILVSVDGLLPAFYLDERWPAPAEEMLWEDSISRWWSAVVSMSDLP